MHQIDRPGANANFGSNNAHFNAILEQAIPPSQGVFQCPNPTSNSTTNLLAVPMFQSVPRIHSGSNHYLDALGFNSIQFTFKFTASWRTIVC
jgi:hypothetical protein